MQFLVDAPCQAWRQRWRASRLGRAARCLHAVCHHHRRQITNGLVVIRSRTQPSVLQPAHAMRARLCGAHEAAIMRQWMHPSPGTSICCSVATAATTPGSPTIWSGASRRICVAPAPATHVRTRHCRCWPARPIRTGPPPPARSGCSSSSRAHASWPGCRHRGAACRVTARRHAAHARLAVDCLACPALSWSSACTTSSITGPACRAAANLSAWPWKTPVPTTPMWPASKATRS